MCPMSCISLMILESHHNELYVHGSRCMASPCIGMLAQGFQHEGLGRPRDASNSVSAAKKREQLLLGCGGPIWFGIRGSPLTIWRWKGIAKGPATSSTLVAELPRLEVDF